MSPFKDKLMARVLTVLLTCVAGAVPATAQGVHEAPVKVSVRTDSMTVTMGDHVHVTVEVLKNGHEGVVLGMPDMSQVAQNKNMVATMGTAEVRKVDVDSIDHGNKRIQVDYDIVLQPFEPGTMTVGPFAYAYKGDTVASDILSIKVLEVEMPQVMKDSLYINPMRGVLSVESRWYDFIPDTWPWYLLGLVVLALIVIGALLYKKNGPMLIKKRRMLPPYDVARKRLDAIRKEHLAEKATSKHFYTVLTDVLRQYLGAQFKIYAREMTSAQILAAVDADAKLAGHREMLVNVLELADLVKFAKLEAAVNQKMGSLRDIEDFVEQTKPLTQQDNKNSKS